MTAVASSSRPAYAAVESASELAFRIPEHGFFLRELALERRLLGRLGRSAIFLGETGRRFRSGVRRDSARRPDRGHRHALFADDATFLAGRICLLVRQYRAAVLVLAVPQGLEL